MFEYKIRQVPITKNDVDKMNKNSGRPLRRSMDVSSVKEDATGKGYTIEQRHISGLDHFGKDVFFGALPGAVIGSLAVYSGLATNILTAVKTILLH